MFYNGVSARIRKGGDRLGVTINFAFFRISFAAYYGELYTTVLMYSFLTNFHAPLSTKQQLYARAAIWCFTNLSKEVDLWLSCFQEDYLLISIFSGYSYFRKIQLKLTPAEEFVPYLN